MMIVMTESNKKDCRAKLARIRETLAPAYFDAANAQIQKRVFEFEPFCNARNTFIYMATSHEPQTWELIRKALSEGKGVYVPVCDSATEMSAVRISSKTLFSPNRFGIREPVGATEIMGPAHFDLAIIPCVSADLQGGRLGHGAGYYDRFLCQTKAAKLCLCFDALLSNTIPMDPFDVPMDYIITESKKVSCC